MNQVLLNKVKLAALHLDKQHFMSLANSHAKLRMVRYMRIAGDDMSPTYFDQEKTKLTESLTELYHIWDEVHSH